MILECDVQYILSLQRTDFTDLQRTDFTIYHVLLTRHRAPTTSERDNNNEELQRGMKFQFIDQTGRQD